MLDRLISYLNPAAGQKRAKARYLETTYRRGFEGASLSRRTDGWFSPSTSADAETDLPLQRLRDRSRQMVRNDTYAARIVQLVASNVVGHGIVPKARHKDPKIAALAQTTWKKWAETSACDFLGRKHFYAMQSLGMRAVPESGEFLIKRIRVPANKGEIPLKIQLLEPDYINQTIIKPIGTKIDPGNFIRQGIEFDQDGKIVAYHLWSRHPYDYGVYPAVLTTIRVPAEDIIHVYREDRIGQTRGVPWMSSALVKLGDLKDYDDAQLMKQKVSACFAGFVHDNGDLDDVPASSKDPHSIDQDGQQGLERLEPGLIEHLPPGKDITFPSPPAVDGYSDFHATTVRRIAAGPGVSYEALSGDYSQVNFSSAKMGRQEFDRSIDDWRWNMLVPTMCQGVWQWFVEAAALNGIKILDVDADWTAPARQMIDPSKEVGALKDAVRSGFMTWPEAVREQGYDPETQLAEIKDFNAKMDTAKVILDTDPRKITMAGQPTNSNPDGGAA